MNVQKSKYTDDRLGPESGGRGQMNLVGKVIEKEKGRSTPFGGLLQGHTLVG